MVQLATKHEIKTQNTARDGSTNKAQTVLAVALLAGRSLRFYP